MTVCVRTSENENTIKKFIQNAKFRPGKLFISLKKPLNITSIRKTNSKCN